MIIIAQLEAMTVIVEEPETVIAEETVIVTGTVAAEETETVIVEETVTVLAATGREVAAGRETIVAARRAKRLLSRCDLRSGHRHTYSFYCSVLDVSVYAANMSKLQSLLYARCISVCAVHRVYYACGPDSFALSVTRCVLPGQDITTMYGSLDET